MREKRAIMLASIRDGLLKRERMLVDCGNAEYAALVRRETLRLMREEAKRSEPWLRGVLLDLAASLDDLPC